MRPGTQRPPSPPSQPKAGGLRLARACCGLLLALALGGCPAPPPSVDGGAEADGGALPACDSPMACKVAGFAAVCRAGQCRADVPCTDDVECGLGERCEEGRCVFGGCTADAECSTGKCRLDVYTCAECGKNADCPRTRPVCEAVLNTCLQCRSDADCGGGPVGGPAYCNSARGACVYCQSSDHCPNGLTCGADGVCQGAKKNEACSEGTACDVGLMCVSLNSSSICLTPCSLYTPNCPTGQLCLKLTFSGSNSLVFDKGEPLGICYDPFAGLKYYREACTRTATTQSCQPNLECVPDSAQTAYCRAFCNPNASGTCPSGEQCHPFPGDYDDHRYGLCYADTGYGDACKADAQCRANQVCTPADDPAADEGMSTFCHFKVGAAPALAPCASVAGPDGGLLTPDAVCASGACRGDDPLRPAKFFCYGACRTDGDCADAGHPGTCEGDFEFTGNNVTATLKGCRPSCQAGSDCAVYGGAITCRTSLTVSYYVPKLSQFCAPQMGAARLGQACTVHGDCREGHCYKQDGRGVARRGLCVLPCLGAADCAAGGGSPDGGGFDAGPVPGPLGCLEVALLGSFGYDGVPVTADDRHLVARQCGGLLCASDEDCSGGALCAPDPSPTTPLSQLVLRCLPPSIGGAKVGGEACASDAECLSGACAQLQPPSTGTGKVCLMPCSGSTVCPGATTCQPAGASLLNADGTLQSFTACTP